MSSPFQKTRQSLVVNAPTGASLLSLYSTLPSSTHPSSPFHQYLLLSQLTTFLRQNRTTQLSINIPQLLPTHDFQYSQLWQLFHYEIWKHETSDVEVKKLCKYYQLFSEWVNVYEESISRPENMERCFVEIDKFVRASTEGFFQRVVLVDQSYQDLKGVVKFKGFWEEESQEGDLQSQLEEGATVENLQGLLQLLHLLIYRSDIFISGSGLYESTLANTLAESLNYQHFVYRSLLFLLNQQKIVHHKEMDITKLSIKFAILTNNKTFVINLISKLVKLTSKAVKFACISDYQSLAEILELRGKFQCQQQLQNIQQFRQLNLKKVQNASVQNQPISNQSYQINIPRGASHTIYFQVLKPRTLLMVQFYLDTNINVSIAYEGDLWAHNRNVYYNESKCTSRSLQIQVNDCGLHSITFDNVYSWINSKRVKFDVMAFRPVEGFNHEFALAFSDDYVPWRGYYVNEVIGHQQNQYFTLWQQYKPIFIDILCKGGKVFYRGQLYGPQQFTHLQIGKITSYIIEDSPQQYTPLLQFLKSKYPGLEPLAKEP